MAWGEGDRRSCPGCGQSVAHITDTLSHRELRGPRNITSSNLDRVFDDRGRLLLIEEKRQDELLKDGQKRLLMSLANLGDVTVWLVRGTPDRLRVDRVKPKSREFVPEPLVEDGNWEDYQRLVGEWFAAGGFARNAGREPCGCSPLGSCDFHANREWEDSRA